MEHTPDISMIVPIYNVEAYLPRCVESLLNQTHQNIEIILVDDESPDNCGKMVDEYAAKDSRVKVIHQKNKWLGGARNSGLKIATGKYVCFVDSDDYVRTDMCELLFHRIEEEQTDMVIFDIYHVSKEGEIKSIGSPSILPNKIISGTEAQHLLYSLIISSHSINKCVPER